MSRMTALSTLSTTALKSTVSAAAAVALCASLASLTGCSAPDPDRKYRTDLDSLSADLSPELKNTSQTHDEARMDWVVNKDQDLRGAWSDLGRVWLTDKPSSLSPYPIMQTNGNP